MYILYYLLISYKHKNNKTFHYNSVQYNLLNNYYSYLVLKISSGHRPKWMVACVV